jgi:5'-nucleotidase
MRKRTPLLMLTGWAGAALLAALPVQGAEEGEILIRHQGEADISWRAARTTTEPVMVRILGVNDFHGQLEARTRVGSGAVTRPVGGAAVLGAYLAAERSEDPKRTLTLFAGDSIGASQLAAGLLHEEPAMAVLNELAAGDCPRLRPDSAGNAAPIVTRCRVLATVGNHEFDQGTAELERLLYGGRHPTDHSGRTDWAGSRIPFLAANVVRRDGQRPLLPPAAIVTIDGVRIGVIGTVTQNTPALVVPERIRDLNFLPEAASINAAVAMLHSRGVHAIVLLIHEGLIAPTNPQPAPLAPAELHGRLGAILSALDGGIDVVVAGHTHKACNLLVPLRDGSVTLVTQARSYGTAYSAIDLTLDRTSGAVVAKSARIMTTWGDTAPGHEPNRAIGRIVAAAVKATAPVQSRAVGTAASAIRRGEPTDAESALGNLVADAQRQAAGTEFAFMNAAGIRNDLEAGPLTFGNLYDALPFGNMIIRMTLTGEQIERLLEQQWSGYNAGTHRFLRVSGLRYRYAADRIGGRRLLSVEDAAGLPLETTRRYTVAANDFIVGGGDGYTVLAEGAAAIPVMRDIEALEAYVTRNPGPLHIEVDGRVRGVGSARP